VQEGKGWQVRRKSGERCGGTDMRRSASLCDLSALAQVRPSLLYFGNPSPVASVLQISSKGFTRCAIPSSVADAPSASDTISDQRTGFKMEIGDWNKHAEQVKKPTNSNRAIVVMPTVFTARSESPSPKKNRKRETWTRPGTASATTGIYHPSAPSILAQLSTLQRVSILLIHVHVP
jgi:hypothetical protein